MRRADRLLRIVHFLRGRRQAVTAQQIAEEFEICTRTVYRDIQDLVYSGAPIIGEAGVGYMIDKQYYLPPITFEAEELEAISLGISMVRQTTDDRFAGKADSAYEKMKAVLPTKLQGELQQVTTFAMPGRDMPDWSVSFSELRECIRARRKVHITYVDDQDRRSQRIIRPLAMVFFNPVWLLAAWCDTREDFRNFRLDRIEDYTASDEGFKDEPDKDLAAYRAIEDCF